MESDYNPSENLNDKIIRGITEKHVTSTNKENMHRCIASFAFNCPKPVEEPISDNDIDGMSVFIESLIIKAGKDPHEFVQEFPEYIGTVYITVGELQELDLTIRHKPVYENEFHGIVHGPPPKWSFSDGKKKEIRKLCKWYNEIPDDVIELVMKSKS